MKKDLEADGIITVYEIETGKVVEQYEGMDAHWLMTQAPIWRQERAALLAMTSMLDEHPEGYEGPCLCKYCQSYSGEEAIS